MTRGVLSWVVYPATMAGAFGVNAVLLSTGLPILAAAYAAAALAAGAVTFFEFVIPYDTAWQPRWTDVKNDLFLVPLRDRCSFGRFPWLISQALSVTYMAGERRLYLERNCRLPESPAHSRQRNREGPASSKGLNSQRGFGPAVEPRRKSRPRSTSLHGSSPCKCQRLSTLRWDRLPPSRPSTKSGARAGGRRLSDRRLHRWLAGTSASAPSSHGSADLLGLNRAHICVRNPLLHGRSPDGAATTARVVVVADAARLFRPTRPADAVVAERAAACPAGRPHASGGRAAALPAARRGAQHQDPVAASRSPSFAEEALLAQCRAVSSGGKDATVRARHAAVHPRRCGRGGPRVVSHINSGQERGRQARYAWRRSELARVGA